MTGFNLPPGCNVSDIPGNRPEDEEWEQIEIGFYGQEFTKEQNSFITNHSSDAFMDLITKAISYGIDIGMGKQAELESERKFYAEENGQ